MNKKMKKVAIYARVSKSDESQNPINQLEPLRKWADSLGYEIVEEYVDYASGGNSNRPNFQRMLSDVRRRKFQLVLVAFLDRFSREGISNTLSYLETLKRHDVGLKSLNESWLDTTDEGIGKLLIAIFSWVAKQERDRMSKRIKAGQKIARKNGAKIGKRGKDKVKRRKRSGYLLRWAKQRGEIKV